MLRCFVGLLFSEEFFQCGQDRRHPGNITGGSGMKAVREQIFTDFAVLVNKDMREVHVKDFFVVGIGFKDVIDLVQAAPGGE